MLKRKQPSAVISEIAELSGDNEIICRFTLEKQLPAQAVAELAQRLAAKRLQCQPRIVEVGFKDDDIVVSYKLKGEQMSKLLDAGKGGFSKSESVLAVMRQLVDAGKDLLAHPMIEAVVSLDTVFYDPEKMLVQMACHRLTEESKDCLRIDGTGCYVNKMYDFLSNNAESSIAVAGPEQRLAFSLGMLFIDLMASSRDRKLPELPDLRKKSTDEILEMIARKRSSKAVLRIALDMVSEAGMKLDDVAQIIDKLELERKAKDRKRSSAGRMSAEEEKKLPPRQPNEEEKVERRQGDLNEILKSQEKELAAISETELRMAAQIFKLMELNAQIKATNENTAELDKKLEEARTNVKNIDTEISKLEVELKSVQTVYNEKMEKLMEIITKMNQRKAKYKQRRKEVEYYTDHVHIPDTGAYRKALDILKETEAAPLALDEDIERLKVYSGLYKRLQHAIIKQRNELKECKEYNRLWSGKFDNVKKELIKRDEEIDKLKNQLEKQKEKTKALKRQQLEAQSQMPSPAKSPAEEQKRLVEPVGTAAKPPRPGTDERIPGGEGSSKSHGKAGAGTRAISAFEVKRRPPSGAGNKPGRSHRGSDAEEEGEKHNKALTSHKAEEEDEEEEEKEERNTSATHPFRQSKTHNVNYSVSKSMLALPKEKSVPKVAAAAEYKRACFQTTPLPDYELILAKLYVPKKMKDYPYSLRCPGIVFDSIPPLGDNSAFRCLLIGLLAMAKAKLNPLIAWLEQSVPRLRAENALNLLMSAGPDTDVKSNCKNPR